MNDMASHKLFEVLFPGDELTKYLTRQPSHLQWMDLLESKLKPIVTRRGQMLSVVGKVPDTIYFLTKGAIKGYRDQPGKQQVIYLWDELSVVVDIINYIQETPSDLYIEVTQDTSLVMLEREAITSVISEFPESIIFLNSILFQDTRYHKERYIDFLTLNGFEKFQKLLSTRKMIDMIFSKNDLASFLGLSRSSFSAFYRRNRG